MDTPPHVVLEGVQQSHRRPAASLYVHVPFCKSRCHYCDFTTYVAPSPAVEAYVANLEQELAMLSELSHQPLQTVFFGGGTPTLLSASLLKTACAAVVRNFALDPDCEWTVEANPGTLTSEKLSVLREVGVNRISFGAQTFDERLLLAIGRSHDVDAVYASVEEAKRVGFEHINIDLMFGLPEQTLSDVEQAIDHTLQLDVDHVSAYWLKVEPGTPFGRWQEAGLLPLPGEDAEADMFDYVLKTLCASGYEHYEVSNFARSGGKARHNLVYWHNEPYLAAGVGAHGYMDGERYENVTSLLAYQQHIQGSRRPIESTHRVSEEEFMEDTMMLGLRLAEGVSRDTFLERHGVPMESVFAAPIAWGLQHGLLKWKGHVLCLTDRAWPIANLVFEKFIDAE